MPLAPRGGRHSCFHGGFTDRGTLEDMQDAGSPVGTVRLQPKDHGHRGDRPVCDDRRLHGVDGRPAKVGRPEPVGHMTFGLTVRRSSPPCQSRLPLEPGVHLGGEPACKLAHIPHTGQRLQRGEGDSGDLDLDAGPQRAWGMLGRCLCRCLCLCLCLCRCRCRCGGNRCRYWAGVWGRHRSGRSFRGRGAGSRGTGGIAMCGLRDGRVYWVVVSGHECLRWIPMPPGCRGVRAG